MAATPLEIITTIVDDVHDEIMRALVDAGRAPADTPRDIGQRLEAIGMSSDAEASVRAICERMFGAEVETEPIVRLLAACAEGASPDLAVRNVERYLDRLGTPSIFMSTIASAPPLLNMITTVFGASQYMADILVRNPGNVYWLMEKATWDVDDSVDHYRSWFSREA